jgi:hypothetical protein
MIRPEAASEAGSCRQNGTDRTVLAYLKYRSDTPQHLSGTLAADPEFGLAHCLAGSFAMLSYKLANVPVAAEAARTARAMTMKANARERTHVEALDAWIAGDIDRTLTIWDDIVTEHPMDVPAFRLAHINNFWLGRREAMRASAEQVFPKWGRNMPGFWHHPVLPLLRQRRVRQLCCGRAVWMGRARD